MNNKGAKYHKNKSALILHAPNVHAGGGLVLLRLLLSVPNLSLKWAQLDTRVENLTLLSNTVFQYYVKRTIFSRLFAEWRLWRKSMPNDIVLCFHGLPPLFPTSAHVVVFIQNRILLEKDAITGYPLRVKVRLLMERFWLRATHKHSTRYIVQTPSMLSSLSQFLNDKASNKRDISYIPFVASSTLVGEVFYSDTKSQKKYDFLYVASGDAHKNHVNLLKAWCLLAESGFTPSLALTVNPLLFPDIAEMIAKFSQEFSLNINNMGQLSSQDINLLYQSSGALIYPSSTESFGLPLIEAMVHKLPIIASELDYVRDVVVPVETFNPDSPVSIARAVRRFLDDAEPVIQLQSAEDFLAEVLK